jgi:hypothetical protein
MGLIAQDVKRRNPDAVIRDKSSGFLMVDYGKALKNSTPKRMKKRA